MKPKRNLIRPTDAEDAAITAAAHSDPDALPFSAEDLTRVTPLVQRGRGRPIGSGSKTQVTLRLDTEILNLFKAAGSGWQTRINDALREWAKH